MFQIHVRVRVYDSNFFEGPRYIWLPVRPSTNGSPYTYELKTDAIKMMNMCYPELASDDVKIVEVA